MVLYLRDCETFPAQVCLETEPDSFTIDYDIDGAGNEIAAGEILGGRLRRVSVTGTEVDNEIIVLDNVVEYQIDKLYGTW